MHKRIRMHWPEVTVKQTTEGKSCIPKPACPNGELWTIIGSGVGCSKSCESPGTVITVPYDGHNF